MFIFDRKQFEDREQFSEVLTYVFGTTTLPITGQIKRLSGSGDPNDGKLVAGMVRDVDVTKRIELRIGASDFKISPSSYTIVTFSGNKKGLIIQDEWTQLPFMTEDYIEITYYSIHNDPITG